MTATLSTPVEPIVSDPQSLDPKLVGPKSTSSTELPPKLLAPKPLFNFNPQLNGHDGSGHISPHTQELISPNSTPPPAVSFNPESGHSAQVSNGEGLKDPLDDSLSHHRRHRNHSKFIFGEKRLSGGLIPLRTSSPLKHIKPRPKSATSIEDEYNKFATEQENTDRGPNLSFSRFRPKKSRSKSDAGISTKTDQQNQQESSFSPSFGRRTLRKSRSRSDAGLIPSELPLKAESTSNNAPSTLASKRNKVLGSLSFEFGSNHGNDGYFSNDETRSKAAAVPEPSPLTPATAERNPRIRFMQGRNTSVIGTGDTGSPSAFRRKISAFNADVGSSIAWKDLKNSLKKGFGTSKKKKEEERDNRDYEKSTELIKELAAGAPAAIILASAFQRDEKGTKRIPVLLEQIKFKITDITSRPQDKRRQYRIDLEYGSGPARLSWHLIREYKEFLVLHSKLKIMGFQSNPFDKKIELPRFPSRHDAAATVRRVLKSERGQNRLSTIPTNPSPLLRPPIERVPSVGSTGYDLSNASSSSLSISMSSNSLSGSSFRSAFRRERDNIVSTLSPSSSHQANPTPEAMELKTRVYEQLLQDMEKYLKSLFQLYGFRPDANRLFQFLELSNMSIRLAPEHSYHGKEGPLYVRSSAQLQGWRVSHWRPNDISQMVGRHLSKWFMVRHSYIVVVDDIYSTNVREVFLVDSSFKVTAGKEEHTEFDQLGVRINSIGGGGGAGHSPKKRKVHISFQLENNERKMKILTTSERQMRLWIASIEKMQRDCIWSKANRLGSFAPVRSKAYAQWFVDGVSKDC